MYVCVGVCECVSVRACMCGCVYDSVIEHNFYGKC